MNKISKFIKLSLFQKKLYVETIFLLGLARLVLLVIPFKWIAPRLGQHMKTIHEQDFNKNYTLICNISHAVGSVSRYTPWESKCFVQAIAARWMLRKQGIGGTLYLGVAKEKDNYLKAHAWFKCGDRIVTGAKGHENFTVVSFFNTNSVFKKHEQLQNIENMQE